MRHTRSHTKNRRSHHALTEPRLSTCDGCGEKKVRHQVCEACGVYRGRQVLDVKTRDARTEARRKAKLKAIGQPTGGNADAKEEKAEEPLSPESLSEKKKK